jgi:aryl carrier-like protein
MTPDIRQEVIEILEDVLVSVDELEDDESIYVGIDTDRIRRLLTELRT